MASVPDCPALIVRLRVAVAVWAVGFVKSVTVMVTFAVPGVVWVGVPEMVPVVALIESPLGNPVALKVKGEEPPVTSIVALYGAPIVPFGREFVVMVSVFACWAALTDRKERRVGKECRGRGSLY